MKGKQNLVGSPEESLDGDSHLAQFSPTNLVAKRHNVFSTTERILLYPTFAFLFSFIARKIYNGLSSYHEHENTVWHLIYLIAIEAGIYVAIRYSPNSVGLTTNRLAKIPLPLWIKSFHQALALQYSAGVDRLSWLMGRRRLAEGEQEPTDINRLAWLMGWRRSAETDKGPIGVQETEEPTILNADLESAGVEKIENPETAMDLPLVAGNNLSLSLYSDYTRKEAHDIFSPHTVFMPGAGSWGLQGIVTIVNSPNDFVFFVNYDQRVVAHTFDESINGDGVLTWQSQPHQTLQTKQILKFIRHDDLADNIYLFLRDNASHHADVYTYMGRLRYLGHDVKREKPVYFRWQIIEGPPPPKVLRRMGLELDKPDIPREHSSNEAKEAIFPPAVTPDIGAVEDQPSHQPLGDRGIDSTGIEEASDASLMVSNLRYTRIDTLKCPARTLNALDLGSLYTVHDVLDAYVQRFVDIRNFGPQSFADLISGLWHFGLLPFHPIGIALRYLQYLDKTPYAERRNTKLVTLLAQWELISEEILARLANNGIGPINEQQIEEPTALGESLDSLVIEKINNSETGMDFPLVAEENPSEIKEPASDSAVTLNLSLISMGRISVGRHKLRRLLRRGGMKSVGDVLDAEVHQFFAIPNFDVESCVSLILGLWDFGLLTSKPRLSKRYVGSLNNRMNTKLITLLAEWELVEINPQEMLARLISSGISTPSEQKESTHESDTQNNDEEQNYSLDAIYERVFEIVSDQEKELIKTRLLAGTTLAAMPGLTGQPQAAKAKDARTTISKSEAKKARQAERIRKADEGGYQTRLTRQRDAEVLRMKEAAAKQPLEEIEKNALDKLCRSKTVQMLCAHLKLQVTTILDDVSRISMIELSERLWGQVVQLELLIALMGKINKDPLGFQVDDRGQFVTRLESPTSSAQNDRIASSVRRAATTASPNETNVGLRGNSSFVLSPRWCVPCEKVTNYGRNPNNGIWTCASCGENIGP